MKTPDRIPIPLDSEVLVETLDGAGELPLKLTINGDQIPFRFPTLGEWGKYCQEVAQVFHRLTIQYHDLMLPHDENSPSFPQWAAAMSLLTLTQSVQRRIIHIISRYLLPQQGNWFTHWRWKRHLKGIPMPEVANLLAAILLVDYWIKKKSQTIMEEILQIVPLVTSSPSSMNIGESKPSELAALASSQYMDLSQIG